MKTAAGGHQRPIRLDSMVEVPGGVVGTDPYRRWGPIFRWPCAILDTFLARGQGAGSHFNKRDVVVADISRTQEFYREGPYSAWAANNRKTAIATTIKTEGLDSFFRRMQVEQSTIGPVSVTAPSGKVGAVRQARVSFRLWLDSFGGGSKWSRNHDGQRLLRPGSRGHTGAPASGVPFRWILPREGSD